MLNQKPSDLGIPNRFKLDPSRSRLHPTFDGVPVAEMIKTIIDPRIERLEEAVEGKNSTQFIAAFDELTNGCNSCHAGPASRSTRSPVK